MARVAPAVDPVTVKPIIARAVKEADNLGTYIVVISNATPNDAAAIELQRALEELGYKCFQQRSDRFAKESKDWKRAWFPNAQGAALIVALVSPAYLASEACATEVGLGVCFHRRALKRSNQPPPFPFQ